MAAIFAMSNIWSDHRVWCGMTVLDDERDCLKSGIHQKRITPYEGLNLANQNNRKLEVFGRKLEETSQHCIDILINIISESDTILFN